MTPPTMSRKLLSALNGIPEDWRSVLAADLRHRAADARRQSHPSPAILAAIFEALAVEIDLVALRAVELHVQLEADFAEPDEQPWPDPPIGQAMFFDPDTRTFRPVEEDR